VEGIGRRGSKEFYFFFPEIRKSLRALLRKDLALVLNGNSLSRLRERGKRPFAREPGVFSWFMVPQRGMKNCGEIFLMESRKNPGFFLEPPELKGIAKKNTPPCRTGCFGIRPDRIIR
jgi:hypothetical protein